MSLVEVNNRKNEADQSEEYLRGLTKTFTGLEKPLKNVKIAETLDDLITELHNVFNSDRVNIEYVNHLLLSYKSNPKEWKRFAKFDRFKWVRNFDSFIHSNKQDNDVDRDDDDESYLWAKRSEIKQKAHWTSHDCV